MKAQKCRYLKIVTLLTKVTLSCCAVNLPVAQIRELRIPHPRRHEGTIRASLALVRQCPVLEVLCVCTYLSGEVVHIIDIVTTPTIQKLETDFIAIINKLVLPSLREAILSEYEPCEAPIDHMLPAFRRLLHRSDCARTFASLKLVDLSLRSPSW
ncbi:hypothetical protein CPB85DRAFT_1437416 [Mucidula mucida]|nr:hypothetical protein CPB85DRAFT_260041 [Mucidula mucida]KAF8905335.1 hypothetical protein CPB85DRAFT_1437416 [Mucidula mucida]